MGRGRKNAFRGVLAGWLPLSTGGAGKEFSPFSYAAGGLRKFASDNIAGEGGGKSGGCGMCEKQLPFLRGSAKNDKQPDGIVRVPPGCFKMIDERGEGGFDHHARRGMCARYALPFYNPLAQQYHVADRQAVILIHISEPEVLISCGAGDDHLPQRHHV